jgi:HK97 family phage portal protein
MALRWLRRASHVPVLDVSIGSPAFADMLLGAPNDSGRPVTERTALGSSGVFAVARLISNAIAGLDFAAYSGNEWDPAPRTRIVSILDDPCAPWFTDFEFKQIVGIHMALHGNAFLLHVYNGAGELVSLFPVHPNYVSTCWRIDNTSGLPYREYTIALPQTTPQVYTDADVTHIMGMSVDGLTGVSPITALRNMIGTGLAGDQAAAKQFSQGLMMGGIITQDPAGPDLTPDQAAAISSDLQAKTAGSSNAGKWTLINKALKISPWQMTAEQGQFLESRSFQVEEISRAWGIPKVFLSEDGASTWGSGIRELASYLGKFTLRGYTDPMEARFARLLGPGVFVCADYHTLLEGTPDEEDSSLINLVRGGVMTPNEARATKQLPPLEGGDKLELSAAPPPLGAQKLPATATEGN